MFVYKGKPPCNQSSWVVKNRTAKAGQLSQETSRLLQPSCLIFADVRKKYAHTLQRTSQKSMTVGRKSSLWANPSKRLKEPRPPGPPPKKQLPPYQAPPRPRPPLTGLLRAGTGDARTIATAKTERPASHDPPMTRKIKSCAIT